MTVHPSLLTGSTALHLTKSPPTPAAVWLLMTVVAVVGSNSLALGPIAPDIARDLGAGITATLRASAAFGLGTAISALLLARYIDHKGARFVLSCAVAVLTLSFAICTVAQNVVVLGCGQLFAGLAAGVALPACYTSAAIIAPENQESRVLGLVLIGWTVSLVFGVSLSALISDSFHWRAVYMTLAVFSATAFIRVTRSDIPNRTSLKNASTPLTAFKVPGVPYLLFVVACYMTAFYGVYNFVGDHIVEALRYSVKENAWIAISYGTGFGLATLLDPMLDRLTNAPGGSTRFRLPNIALTCLAVVYIVLAISAGSYPALVIAAGLWGMFNHLGLNILIAALNATDSKQRGAIIGLYSCITYLCLAIGTVGYGVIYEASSFIVLCITSTCMCLVAVAAGVVRRN